MDKLDPTLWPGWEVTRLIGSGTAGSVYEIQRNLYGTVEKAALKVLHIPQHAGDIDELYSDGFDNQNINERLNSYLQTILQEYNMMAGMKGHANIVYCDDVRQIPHADGIGWDVYIKMELLRPLGKSLGDTIPEEQVIDIGIDMCSALTICRQMHIVHRDIKPQNIFIARDGTYKLGDFGIAKTSVHTTIGTKTGTYKYMAPEVFKALPYGTSADQYSLGLVLYWLLNERRAPFSPLPPEVPTFSQEEEARMRRFEGEQIPPPLHGSPALQAIVLKACAYDPKDRFSGPEEMQEALKIVKAGGDPRVAVPAPKPKEPEQETKNTRTAKGRRKNKAPLDPVQKRRRLSGILAGSFVGVLLLAALLATLLSGKGKKPTTPTELSTQPTTVPSETPAETMLPPIQENWSLWVERLPDYVTPEDYDIVQRKMYSSRELEIAQSTADTMVGWELFDTVDGNGAWGVWSLWSPYWVAGTETRQVQTQTLYRHSDKETTTGSSDTMAGWTLEKTTYSYGDFGDWSDWSETSVEEAENREVETQTLYRSRDRETTTAESASLEGWILDEEASEALNQSSWSEWTEEVISEDPDVEVQTKTQYRSRDVVRTYTYSEWGSWSKWQTTPVEEDDVTQVKTREVEVGTRYLMGHYCAAGEDSADLMEGTSPQSFDGAEYHELGWFDSLSDFTRVGSFRKKTCYRSSACSNGRDIWYIMGKEPLTETQYRFRTREREETVSHGKWSAWTDDAIEESDDREVRTRTLYRSRAANTAPTYVFYRWTDWTDWSGTAVQAGDDREVETLLQYRSRERSRIPAYLFSRWTDWTDWSETPVSETASRKVDTTTRYRYRDQLEETTYFFRRWGEWSPFTDQKRGETDTREVQEKLLYCYRSKALAPQAGDSGPVLTASNVVDTGKITLSWEPSEGVEQYLVFRADPDTGIYTLMKIADHPGYTNVSSQPGESYSYLVCTLGEDGTTGPFSAPIIAVCMLAQPEVKGSHSSAGKNLLTWTAVDEAAYYQVYRSDLENGDYILLKTTTKLNFTNTESEKDKTYYYKVRAMASDANIVSAFSEPVELTAKK